MHFEWGCCCDWSCCFEWGCCWCLLSHHSMPPSASSLYLSCTRWFCLPLSAALAANLSELGQLLPPCLSRAILLEPHILTQPLAACSTKYGSSCTSCDASKCTACASPSYTLLSSGVSPSCVCPSATYEDQSQCKCELGCWAGLGCVAVSVRLGCLVLAIDARLTRVVPSCRRVWRCRLLRLAHAVLSLNVLVCHNREQQHTRACLSVCLSACFSVSPFIQQFIRLWVCVPHFFVSCVCSHVPPLLSLCRQVR